MRSLSSFVVLVLALLVCSCGDDAAAPALDGRTFLLDSAEGFEPISGTTVRLSFRDGELSVSAGCNSMGGPYELRGAELVLNGLSTTDIGCFGARPAQDAAIGAFFTSRPQLVLAGDQLTLSNAEITLRFLDREVADPDRPLVGTLWTIDSYIEGGGVGNGPATKSPTVQFAEGGAVEIDSTCNKGSGQYTVSGDQITLENVTYTDRACDAAAQSLETKVQAVMRDGTLTFKIEAQRLTLMRGSMGLSGQGP